MQQIVDKNTRQNKILDKCYTNCSEFYHKIEVLQNLGKSDHEALLCKPNQNAKCDKGQKCTKQIRVSGKNEKALFVKNLKEINWTGLYRLNSCEEQFIFFDQIMTSLIETFSFKKL